MQLYVTGTVQTNRLPKTVTILNKSNEYKQMNRGEFRKHKFIYNNENGEKKEMGLVCWKDSKLVYCLTNNHRTDEIGNCFRRTAGGRICLERPKVIEYYNQYMGGVDVADMRCLHASSAIMGQNRWWLKLFFIYWMLEQQIH